MRRRWRRERGRVHSHVLKIIKRIEASGPRSLWWGAKETAFEYEERGKRDARRDTTSVYHSWARLTPAERLALSKRMKKKHAAARDKKLHIIRFPGNRKSNEGGAPMH